ncbi:Hypothetical predicted protein [Paramuricea clavata]|uniref:Uncharacterized protein n=1 Tax=Paramuricea clavata TaxID=317549 RepID=A0A7D9JBX5_PARCT|nr:Hypothetical predicted protein [Paramuricea clavata]CAB4026644.1 Hypothetical predicted protein [Paramuricea clavata]
MKINFEIILTRIDALQSLANTQAICFSNDNIVHLESVLDGEGSKSTKSEPTISLMEKEKNSEIEALKSKINSLDMKLEKYLKDYDAISNQSPIVIPQVPIVSPQSPIVPPQAPITPSLHVNKKNHDQTPELQIPSHANKEFLNKLPLCDTQGFNCKQVNNLNETSLLPQHVMTPCQSLESNSSLLSNRSRKLLGKIPNGHRHGIYQSKTSNQETSLLPQHVNMFPCQSLESNSPLLSIRSRKSVGIIPNGHKHGICQSKTSSLRDFTQPQRKIAPFRKSPANYRPPRIVLEKQSMEWAVYLKFVSQMTHKSTLV